MTVADDREAAFTAAMRQVYRNGLSIGYNAGRFNGMLHTHGGIATALHLLRASGVSAGFEKLQSAGHLEWSVEALVLQPEWRSLFSDTDLDIAWRRLERVGYKAPPEVHDATIPDLQTVTSELNRRAEVYEIGRLQDIRRRMKGFERASSKNIFPSKPRHPEWTFHHGGRLELQFNIGFEDRGWQTQFRHGVAFSLETSRSAPTIVEDLLPKVARFNEFMRLNPGAFDDMRMWHWRRGQLSEDSLPAPVLPPLVEEGVFIMVGRHYSPAQIDYDDILHDFDRLLELYCYVEATPGSGESVGEKSAMTFTPGFKRRTRTTSISLEQRTLEVVFRHDDLQEKLYNDLVSEYGLDNVEAEQANSTGFVDVVVRHNTEYWYYEIKTGTSAQACIRQAVAQLLEYSYWPGAIRAHKLVVVGEHPLDPASSAYLAVFREQFGIPLMYQHLQLATPAT